MTSNRPQLIPNDVWSEPSFGTYPALPSAPDPVAVEACLEALLSAKQPIIICGGGVVVAGGESALRQLAESLDITVATTISGQGSLSENHPNCLGVVGSNGGVIETRAVVEEADLVFFIGCRAGSVTTERWRFPKPGTPVLHLDSDPAVIGASYVTEVGLVGDARLGLEALNDRLSIRKFDRAHSGAKRIVEAKKDKLAAVAALMASDDRPILPERIIAELQKVLPSDAVVVADPGTPCPYVSGYYEFRKPGRYFISNRAHGALGYSMAASIGAQIGRPESKVIALMGDGSFGFTAGELETMTRLRLPVTMIVFSNAVYGWIKAGQKTKYDQRYFSVDFSRTDHAAVAAAYGVKSWRVEDPSDLSTVLRKAVEYGGPTLVDIICQPLQDARAPVSEWVA